MRGVGGARLQDNGLLGAFAMRSAVTASPLLAVSQTCIMGNWAARPFLSSIDLAWAAQAAQSGSCELGRITTFEGPDPGYLIEIERDIPRAGSGGVDPNFGVADSPISCVLPGRSDLIASVRQSAMRIAHRQGHVLLCGESGVGKRTLAEYLLELSPKDASITIDATSGGDWLEALRQAIENNAAVVLLHACGMSPDDLPTCMHLLRLASARKQRVVITATPFLPPELYAIAGEIQWRLWVPPLRDRLEDIPDIIEAWPRTRRLDLRRPSSAQLRWLWSRSWPGNLRELAEVLTEGIRGRRSYGRMEPIKEPRALVQRLQKEALLQALARCRGNRSRAAAMLGLSRATLYRKMEQFGISAADY